MYKVLLVFILMFMVFSFVPGVMAQEPTAEPTPIIDPDGPAPTMPEIPTEVPETAVGAVGVLISMLAALFAAFAGLAGYTVVDILKKHLPWLNERSRKQMGDGVTRLLIVAFNGFVGVGASYLMQFAADLDSTGLWSAIATIVTVIGTPVAAEIWYGLNKKSPVIINATSTKA